MAEFNIEPFAIDYHNLRQSAFKAEKSTKNEIVFVGDSFIEFGQWQNLLKNSTIVNRGILGDNSFGLLNRVNDIIDLKPSLLYINIGINDIAREIPANITFKNICTIVKQLKKTSPHTKIFVHSILPTNPIHSEHNTELINHYNKNEQVIQLNNLLKEENKQCCFVYIDLYSLFEDENGNLKMEFADADGIHLNSKGYKIWADMLKNGNYLDY